MSQTDAAKYRSAAERCRRRSSLADNSREWIVFAQNWEQIAEISEALSANKPCPGILPPQKSEFPL
jgi:hypothetical protein